MSHTVPPLKSRTQSSHFSASANSFPPMRYPDRTPLSFSAARTFVQRHGFEVWSALCDTVPADEWFDVTAAARQLGCRAHYQNPGKYLRVVLKAIIADYAERPDDYENRPPVVIRGNRMIEARI